jgi:putative peptide zinc metalloprotease protein
MKGAGYTETPFLIRSPEGAYCRVSELLFRVAQAANGRRDLQEVATYVSRTTVKQVSADNVAWLVRERLKGLVSLVDEPSSAGDDPARSSPFLLPRAIVRLRLRRVIVGEQVVGRVADALQFLFSPVVIMVALALGLVITRRLWADQALRDVVMTLGDPRDVIVGLGLFLFGTVFHEFGHASALRRGGGQPGGLGVGLFLAWPAFFTEVSDSYRLSRWKRLRVDLGGVYFNLVFSIVLFALHLATSYPPFLLATMLVQLEAAHQLLPLVRLDGYYVVADLAGVPDPLRQLNAFLARRTSGTPRPTKDRLKLLPRAGVSLYLLLALPLMFTLLGRVLARIPEIFVSIWRGELEAIAVIGKAASRSDWFSAAAASIGFLVLALIPVGIILTTSSLLSRVGKGMWRWSAGSEARRAVAFSAFAAGFTALALAWMPAGNWKQIQRGFEERASAARPSAVLDARPWDPAPAELWSRRGPSPPRRPGRPASR